MIKLKKHKLKKKKTKAILGEPSKTGLISKPSNS